MQSDLDVVTIMARRLLDAGMAPTPVAGLSRKLILIADDYDHSAQILADFVQFDQRYETMFAKDGDVALRLAQWRRPDVAVLDIDMPTMDGITTARLLSRTYPHDVPIMIAMTGGPRDDEARDSGHFRKVLSKPVNPTDLVDILNSLW